LSDNHGVSAVIMSFRNPGRVVALANMVRDYVDEVIIVHTGPRSALEGLKMRVPFAKVLDLPDLGTIGLYLGVAISSAGNDWILYLEDDYVPSIKLLSSLRELVRNAESRLYRLNRINIRQDGGVAIQRVITLFDRRAVRPTGTLHEHFYTWERFLDLDQSFFIEHREDPLTFYSYLIKLWKYSVYSSLGVPYKLLMLRSPNPPAYNDVGDDLLRQRQMIYSLRICDPIRSNACLFLYELAYFIGSWLLSVLTILTKRQKPKDLVLSGLYYLFLISNAIRNLRFLAVSRAAYEKGSFINLFDLENLDNARKALTGLQDLEGIKNYFTLLKRYLNKIK